MASLDYPTGGICSHGIQLPAEPCAVPRRVAPRHAVRQQPSLLSSFPPLFSLTFLSFSVTYRGAARKLSETAYRVDTSLIIVTR